MENTHHSCGNRERRRGEAEAPSESGAALAAGEHPLGERSAHPAIANLEKQLGPKQLAALVGALQPSAGHARPAGGSGGGGGGGLLIDGFIVPPSILRIKGDVQTPGEGEHTQNDGTEALVSRVRGGATDEGAAPSSPPSMLSLEGAGVAPHDPPVASPQAPAAAEADPQSSPTTPDSKRRRRSAVPSFGSQGSDSCSSGEGSGESCCDTSSSAEPCSQAGNGVHLTHKISILEQTVDELCSRASRNAAHIGQINNDIAALVESKKALLQRVELLQRQLQSREGEVAALQGELQTLRSRPSSPAATASAASGSPRPP
mmetsp:Transcript_18304/g.55080  ORF Transcript_18304/g.55080 Transcript_18304/m.55080 type:complete len:317 (-) Transcript_18304:1984-2934(-)|eukprot:CAMPEP_0206145544 /NCGR_PEP_ID=MMETSP1473-20131121/27699_1 /ASSEMBLY_ACC=CAM_ASM_001109 /TAXON_ID=1461547 /ORGANISM="Stichococcus sp, Strain RCC1054" /LENGTH=316 /DNA_ID=CAMNT_0053541797 /DNA_START=244 /DNA_END=1194 /DNA_ORIENTATION=+